MSVTVLLYLSHQNDCAFLAAVCQPKSTRRQKLSLAYCNNLEQKNLLFSTGSGFMFLYVSSLP